MSKKAAYASKCSPPPSLAFEPLAQCPRFRWLQSPSGLGAPKLGHCHSKGLKEVPVGRDQGVSAGKKMRALLFLPQNSLAALVSVSLFFFFGFLVCFPLTRQNRLFFCWGPNSSLDIGVSLWEALFCRIKWIPFHTALLQRIAGIQSRSHPTFLVGRFPLRN